jgi:hypothetical protein
MKVPEALLGRTVVDVRSASGHDREAMGDIRDDARAAGSGRLLVATLAVPSLSERFTKPWLGAALAAAVGLAVANGCSSDSGTCTTDANCGSGYECGFPAYAGCTAVVGTCFPRPVAMCEEVILGCACDGTDINVACNGLPLGYTPGPLAHSGACEP